MSPSKTSIFYLANSLARSKPPYYRNNVASFTSASSNRTQGGINSHGNLRDEETWKARSEGSYETDTSAGMPNVDNKTRQGYYRENTAEVAKSGVAAAVETGLKVGEMTKQTVDGAWDAAKRTAESFKDTVAADDDNEQPRARSNKQETVEDVKQHADKHVEDLRRRAGGYDLNNP